MASATARDVITRAMRRLAVLDEAEAMNADQGANGLAWLNDLLAGFNAEGIDNAHTDLSSLDSVVNVPDHLIRSVVLLLARDIADPYGVQIMPQMAAQMMQAKQALQAHYNVRRKAVVDRALLTSPAGSYDITRDE